MRRKNIFLIFILLLIMGTISFFAYEKIYREPVKISNPTLVTKVINYDKVQGKWVNNSTIEYEYENSYPKTKKLYEYEDKTPYITTYKYTFKKDKPSKMISTDFNGGKLEVNYENGVVMEDLYTSEDGSSTKKRIFQYGNNDNYFTFVFHKAVNKDITGNNYPTYYAEETDSISIDTKNGLLSKTVNTGLFANYDEGDQDEWTRFNGTYTVNYDENGIVKDTSVVSRQGYSGDVYKFELKKEKGRITEVIKSQYNNSTNKWEDIKKIDIEYSDIEIDKYRYASMINALIMDEENTYYIYSWY